MRQSLNRVRIVGTVKSLKTYEGTTKKGEPFISLDLVVTSKIADKIMENKVSFWTKRSSKLANGYLTASNEYKSIDEYGEENATRVIIDGNYEMNEYISQTGEFKSFPKIKGVFVNRVKDDVEIADAVELKLECVVKDVQKEIGKDGLVTNRLRTKLLSVGYNDQISEFSNIIVGEEIANDFMRLFPVGTTARLNLNINNYVIVKEQEQQAVQAPTGFGQQLSSITENHVIKEYVNETIIIGGDNPVIEGAYTQDEFNQMMKLRELAIREITNSVPATPPSSGFGTGFGSGFGNDGASSAVNDEMPF